VLSRIPVGRLLTGGALLAAVVVFFLWIVPSPDYLYLPNTAKSLSGLVKVQGGRPPSPPGDILFVDVTQRRATWLERLFAFARPEGATLLSGSIVVPKGSTFTAERRQELTDMARSEQVASAVALRAAGFRVPTTLTGVLVEGVYVDVPAARFLRDGDVIVSVDGAPTLSKTALRARIGEHMPGDVLTLGVRRGATSRTFAVRTVADPSDPARPVIGIAVAQSGTVKLPIPISINLGDVGGPSAGLPFALDVLEQLGKDVDHGHRVAATGELDLDGSVHPIGGVKQKTIGARRAGVDVFLVPAGDNAAEAQHYAGNLRVIPVDSFQQALHVLATLPRAS
jgi:Lon-like protease